MDDIQEMVNDRIKELRGQTRRPSPNHSRLSDQQNLPDVPQPQSELAGLIELTDNVLNEIAASVLEITERVSGEYAILERELLDSRLRLLQEAERILDMTLSLKKKSKEMIQESLSATRSYSNHSAGLPTPRVEDIRRNSAPPARASMVDTGVAALFRRTQI